MPLTKQPSFWLQVKPEYLLENFNNLLIYLHQYHYSDQGRNNSDYDATVDCMMQVSADYARKLYSHSMFLPIEGEVDFDTDVNSVIRMLAATVLAEKKRGAAPAEILAALVNIVTRTASHLSDDVTVEFYRILCNCMRRRVIVSLGYSWTDFEEENFSIDILALKLSKVTFMDGPSDALTGHYIENRGLFLLPPAGLPVIAPVNLDTFKKSSTVTLAELPDFALLKVEKKYYEKCADFEEYYRDLQKLFSQQLTVKHSSARRLKEYAPEAEFLVRVTRKRGIMVEAETIDGDYEKVTGKIDLDLNESPGQNRPGVATVASAIHEGDYLMVTLSSREDYAFDLYYPFEDFYRNRSAGCANTESWALFEADYGRGKSFVTEEGVRASVDREILEKLSDEETDELEYAISNRMPVRVKFYSRPPRTDGERFVIYALLPALGEEYATEGDSIPFTSSDADRCMMNEFVAWCADEASNADHLTRSDFCEADPRLALPMLAIFDRILRSGVPEARKRLEYAVCGALLARMLNRDEEFDYFEHWGQYVNSQVMFAQNKEVTPLNVKPSISNCGPALHHARVNSILSRYKRSKDLSRNTSVSDEENIEALETRLCALVNASNDLIGIIDEQELNNIKRSIAHAINVLDEFVPIVDSKTFYGSESIAVEFKTSVVFPSANRRRYASAVADPDIQRWAIIKAVCGFLNTRNGGELIIGVGDSGYATGLTEDMEKLVELGKIPFANMDHYRIYVQNLLDFAFREDGSRQCDSDIARSRITYFAEQNDEGTEVLRIKVQPYENALVKLAAGASERPADIDDSYIRRSGRTLPVTPGLQAEIMKYKNAKNRK